MLANGRKKWKEGPWAVMISDSMKRFPRIWGHLSLYTPLPPLDDQDPGYLRLLVHRQEDDDVTTDAVHEKLSSKASRI